MFLCLSQIRLQIPVGLDIALGEIYLTDKIAQVCKKITENMIHDVVHNSKSKETDQQETALNGQNRGTVK